MKFAILLESNPAEMTEALRWISLLKPYIKQATVGKARKYIASLKYDIAQAKQRKRDLDTDLMKYLDSGWYRIMLFIPKDALNHLVPQKADLEFHTDDEFDTYERNEYYITIRPDNIESDLPTPLPQLVRKYLFEAAIDFKEELKSLLERETKKVPR